MNLLLPIAHWWRGRRQRYIYGTVGRPDGARYENVRLDKETGRVQFVLHRAGTQGHAEDYWHDMGYGWELYFVALPKAD